MTFLSLKLKSFFSSLLLYSNKAWRPFTRNFLLSLLVLIFPSLVFSQTTLVNETVGTAASTTTVDLFTGWATAYTMTGTATISTTANNATYPANNVLFTQDGTSRWWQMSGINTSAYGSLTLSFGIHKPNNTTSGATFTIEVSADGLNYSTLTITALPTGGGTPGWYARTCTGYIPSTPNLRIRFTGSGTGNTDNYRLDNIILTGVASCTSAPAVTNGERCTSGTFTLTASGSAGTYKWYNVSSGGSSLNTTSSYTTPTLASNTTYYVSSVSGACESDRNAVVAMFISPPSLSQVSSSGLQFYYKLDGNSTDASGNSNTALLQGAPSTTTDRYTNASSAYSFNGSSQYLATTNTVTTANTNDETEGLWFKTSSTTGGLLLGLGASQTGTSAQHDRLLYISPAGKIVFGYYNGNNPCPNITTTNSYNDGAWHFVMATFSTTNGIKLYVDGSLISSVAISGTPGTVNGYYWRSGFLQMGSFWPLAPTTPFYFNGSLDDIYVYNRELTASEITSLYTSSNGASNNGPKCNGATLTLSANTVSGATSYSWTGPNSFTSSLQNPTLTMSAAYAGTYSVTVSTAPGCTSNIVSTQVALGTSSVTTPTISAGSTTTFCSGCNVVLTSSAASSYSWSSGQTTQAITATTGGTYTVTTGDGTGCTATSAGTIVTVNSCTPTWTGSTNSTWATGSNWNTCAAPGTTDDVTVPNVTNAPVISAAANCRNLTINASSSLTINSGNTLTIYGNITNNGTYTDNGTSVLSGSTAQSVSGSISFNNLTLNNAAGATLNNATTVKGILTLTSGTLASGGNLTVNLNTGAIDGSGTGSVSGNITTLKTVNSNKYHMISSPLSGMTVNDWNDDITINGGRYANLFTYDETNTDTTITTGWTAQTSMATALTSLKGFCLYLNGATSLDHTGTYTHSATYTSPTLTNTVSNVAGTPKPASDGWNLLGNPYPSALDWNAASGWTKTGIDNAIYCWDGANSRYTSYVGGLGTNGGTQYIPSMQGFWIKVTSPGTGSVAMTNSVRTTTANPAIWRTAAASNVLKLTANSGSFGDETIIRFHDDAQEIFDSELDAYKMDNEDNTPNLYTELNSDQYSINSLPSSSKKIIVPVKLKAGFTGAYTFKAEETESFGVGDSIIFEDRLLGIKQNLRSNPVYTCALTKNDTSGRFYINFRKAELTTSLFNSSVKPSIIINGAEDKINIKFLNENSTIAHIGIYNTIGQEVLKFDNADISNKEYSIRLSNTPNGVYVIKISTDSQNVSKKIYLIK